jgi:histidinol dehydrogenase
MIQTIDLRGSEPTPAALLASVPRALTSVAVAADVAAELIADVRSRGGAALLDQAERLDRVRPGQVRVPASHITDAVAGLDPAVRTAITETIRRVRLASAAQVPPHVTTTIEVGATVTQRWQPVNRVGLYVPGGKAVYPSSVVMNVVPAQVSGVRSIALASPPQSHFDGRVHPTILAVAGLLGVDEIYAMGGAGAIGALAYGVEDIGLDPVQIVTGPGNVYVAAAKRLIRGQSGIDSEAGPTDILVIADAAADPLLVAADLVSQAEHDELAAAVLVTDSPELAEAVAAQLAVLAASTTHSERVTAALQGRQSAIVLVDDLQVAAAFSNEIQTSDPDAVLALIENAGAIFLGPYSPVSLGDYVAGSNHVLPTGGQARFSSGLGAYTFLRPQQVVRYSREALEAVADHIAALSNAEALPAHGDAVAARFQAARLSADS